MFLDIQSLYIKSFWKHIKKTPRFLEYFPDYKYSQLPERFYVNMLFTIDPDFVTEKVIESNTQRKSITKEDEGEYIIIKKELLQEIQDLGLLPSKSYSFRINGKSSPPA